MSKSLQKCILFAVCIALVCALGVTLFIFDGTGGAVTGQEGQASNVAQNTTSYTHGSDIGRQNQTSGKPVGTAEALVDALATSGTYHLTNDINLNSSQIFKDNTFSGTLYGNGYTITLNGKTHSTINDVAEMYSVDSIGSNDAGALISEMRGGKVYDLNIQASGDFKVVGRSNDRNTNVNVGLLAGWITGGSVIDNVSVTLAANSFLMAMGYGVPTNDSHTWHAAGLIGGVVDNNNTITNITATVNGIIDAGTHNRNDQLVHEFGGGIGSSEKYTGVSGAVVGKVEANTTNVKIDNIIVAGSGQMRGACVGLVAFTSSSVSNSTATVNIFNKTTSDVVRGQHYWSHTFLKWDRGSSWTVNNYYTRTGAQDDINAGYAPQNTINIPDPQNVYFDPSANDISNSLAIVHSTSNAPAGSSMKRTYTITGQNGYSSTSTEISTATGTDTVIFRNLPTAASNWSSGGTMRYTVSYTDTLTFDDYLPDPTVYEHGYVPADYTAAAGSTQITSAEQFMSLFRPSGGASTSTPYVLTSDIVISGFSGIDFSGGTLDGAGHTIYIIDKLQDTYTGPAVGGLVGQLGGGTIKNLRIVYVNSIDITVTNSVGRVGLVAGSVNGGTIQNVEVIVQEGVTIGATNTNDHDLAMGGVLGTASGNASIKDVTVELNGTLNPTGKWQSLGGMVGLINSVNGATFTDVAIRGTGTFAGNALNEGQPTFTAAIAVVRSAAQNGSAPQGTYATVDGLIYDLDVKFAGTVQTEGNSNGQYSCYYLFTYNYNNNGDYGDDGWQPNSPISEYNTAVSYSNVFVNSAYKDKLAEYAGQRTNGNAAIGGAVINTVQNKVEGLENPVAAYFNPVDGADDMIFRASGTWDSDRMVILTLSDGTVRESKLETAGVNTSAKLVYAPKTLAATDNVVQLSLYENVNWPTAPAALTYNGEEQSFAFTLHTVSGTPVESGDYTVAYSVKEGNTGALGGNNLPLNAGTYTATIELTNGMEFIDDGQGTTSPEYSLTVTVAPFKVEGNWTYNGGLTITYGDPVPSDIDQYISVSLTTSDIPGGLSAVTASGFTTDYTQGTAAGTTVNITARTYAVNSGLKASNYDFSGITGSGTVEVQKKTLNIDPVSEEPDYMYDPHISAVYGATGDKTAVQAMLTWDAIGRYIEGNYNGEEVTFTIDKIYIAAYDEESGAFTLVNAEEVADENIASLGANSYLITVTADGGNYTVAEGQFFVYGVTPATLTVTGVTFEGGFNGVYDGQAHGVEVQFRGLVGSDVAYNFNITVTGVDGIAVTNAGAYTVTVAADEDNPNYDVGYENGTENEYTVTVEKADYDMTYVTFETASFVYDGTEKTITVSGTLPTGADGIQVTVSYSGTNGTALTNAGSTEITATFATTSANYNVPEANTATLTVTPKDVTFAWSVSGEIVEGMAVEDVKALANPTNNGGILAADTYTFGVDIGDYTAETPHGTQVTFTPSVTFTEEGDAANYNITFNPETAQRTVQLGEVEIAVTQATVNADYVNGYTSAAQFLANFTTSVPDVTIDGENFTVTVTKDGGEAVGFGSLFDVGEYTVTLTSSVYNNLTGTTTYDYVVTATKWTASVAAPEGDLTYDGENKLDSLGITPGDNAGTDIEGAPKIVATVTGGSMVNAGTYTVTLQLQTAEGAVYEGGNFELTAESAEIEIAKRVVEISWAEDTDLIYNGTAHTLTATADFVSGESIDLNSLIAYTGDVTDGSAINAGSYTATITKAQIEEQNANYTLAAESVTQEFTISPATLTLTQAAGATLTRPYDGMVTEATSFLTETYVTITGGVSGENIYGMLNAELTSGVEIKNAGGYVITVTFNAEAAGAGNYSVGDFTSLEIGYTVTAKTITITFDGYEGLTYDGQARTLTATADFVSDENIDLNALIAYTGNVTDGKAVNAGSYTATITKAQIEEKNANYTLAAESATQEFTISPATLTLTQADGAQLSRVYDGTATEASAFVSADYFTVSGYVDGGDEYALFTVAVAEELTIQNADSYTINITLNSGAEGAGNYTCEPFAITYEVTPIQWTASVTAPEGGLTYDGENKLGSLVPTPGDNEGTDIEGAPVIVATVTGGSMVNAGTYTVTLQLQTDGAVYSGGNYELTAESAKIVIAKRVVEIIWAEASDFTYNGLAHTLTATVNNKVGEDEVNATVQLGGDNVSVTEEGFTYTITGLEGTAAENYTIVGAENLTSETQYISRATLTVQFEGITGLVYTGTPYTVTATATGWQNSENYNSTLNGLITIGGDDTQALNAGDYTATITKEALETALDNYTLAQDATVEFTVAPATLNLTIEMKESGSGASVAKPFTWKVSGAVEVSKTADGWTLTSGGVSYNITVTGGEDVENLLNMLKLTLNGSEYNGTPYGTRVQEGKLAVASTDSNYKVVATPIIINIEPDISIEINTGAEYPVSAKYSKDVTYTAADDFAGYFYIDGQPEGTWAYSVEGVESGSFSNVGTYTVKATFTITASGIKLENHFTFNITQATVTGVVLNGEGAYTYGGLKAGDTVSVKVTYSDGNTATVNAGFEAATSTGGYVKAGESVELTLTGDDGKNANYAKVNGQTVTVSVSKAEITANISYMDNSAAEGVLTLPYIGSEGYSNITVSLNGVLGDDVIYGMLKTAIINAGTYDSLEIALNGDDSGSYVITNAADLSVRVTPKEITVEWSNVGGFTYDGTAKAPTATAKDTFDSDEVTLTVTVTGETTEGQAINAGDYTATVKAFVNGNYKLSEDSEQPFSIAKATATLGIENYQGSVEYNGSAVTVTPTVNGDAASEGIVNVTIAYTADGSEAVSADEIRNAGSYTVTLQISGALNYEDASQEFVITVTRAQLTVTTANTSFTYDGSVKGIDRLGVSLSGAVAGDDVSAVIDSVVSGGEPAELKNAGSYTVTYRLEGAAAGNYMITEGGDTVEVKVNAKKLTFTWNSDQTFTYNGAAQVPGYTLNGVVDGDEVTVTVTVKDENATEVKAINAGGYTASVADITDGNYSLTGVQPFSFTIGKADLTLTPGSVTFSDRDADKLSAYSQANYKATIKANVTVTGVGSDGEFNDFTVTTEDDSFKGENGTLTVGNYIFTVRVASGNYNDATYTVTVIEQPVAEFTATPSSRTYTGGEITFTFANESGIQLEEGVQIAVSGITFNGASAASVLDAGSYTVTFAVTGNSADNNYWYTVRSWSGNISPATVEANAVTAVYGDVYTALETGNALQNGRVWQFVTFNGSPVEVTVTVTDATARAGETYLGADTYDVTVTLVSGNFTFAGGSNSVASTLQITRKQLNIAAQLPEDLTYTSEGIVIGLEDYASQLVGDDKVTVAMLVDGEPYVAGVTVLGAGQHTVTVTMKDTSGNYQLAAAQQTFTVEKKEVTSSITVSGETIENNSSLEIVHGENARVQNAIDNYLTQNGVEKGEYTLTVTDSAGQAADLDNISAWAPGTYTVNLGLSDNFEGGMTFTIVVQEGTTAQIPDAPVLPSTPLEDGGSSGVADWLFPLIIAIECLIAIALIVAIVISAIKRGKNA